MTHKKIPWKTSERKIMEDYSEVYSARYIQENFLPHRKLSSVTAQRSMIISRREEKAGIREYVYRVIDHRLVSVRVK